MESKHKLICIVYYIVYLKENFLVDIEKDSLRKIKKHIQVISLFVYFLIRKHDVTRISILVLI